MSYLVETENIPEFEGTIDAFNEFHPLIQFLTERIAYWNNFHGELPIIIKIEKPTPTNTLGIQVNDQTKTSERFS